MKTLLRLLLLAAFLAQGGGVPAQNLTLGTKLELNTLDPHFFNAFAPNSSLAQVFDTLTMLDENLALRPGLATSWRIVDDRTWEFSLRRGVVFHDGTPFTADDVIATITRVPNVPNSPNSFGQYTRGIAAMEKVDEHTLILRTRVPNPTLANDLARVFIIAARNQAATTTDYNTGRAAIGTGPYRLVEWVNGERLALERNDRYWGERAAWARITERVLARDSARLTAFLTGAVDAIDEVPPGDVARVRGDARFAFFSGPAAVVHYIALDSARDESPFVSARDGGAPLARNPLRDPRVRRALSFAINRQAITERVMEGTATPASQLLPPTFDGPSPNLQPDPFDPNRARALLREAGFGDGFRLTLHATSDRYPRDRDIAQAVAQTWSRIGLQVSLEAVPGAMFFGQASQQRYSAFIAQFGTDEASQPLRGLIHTFDAERGLGTANRVRYSNNQVDELIRTALSEMDRDRRRTVLHRAAEMAMQDQALIPVFYPSWTYAAKAGLAVTPRPERLFNSLMIRPRG